MKSNYNQLLYTLILIDFNRLLVHMFFETVITDYNGYNRIFIKISNNYVLHNTSLMMDYSRLSLPILSLIFESELLILLAFLGRWFM